VDADPPSGTLAADPGVVEVVLGGDRPGAVDLVLPHGEVGVERVVVGDLEVALGVLVVPVDAAREVLTAEHAAEPVALDLGHVAHQPVEAHQRRRDGTPAQGVGVEALALEEQRRAMPLEPRLEHRSSSVTNGGSVRRVLDLVDHEAACTIRSPTRRSSRRARGAGR
jgi:hypothetical protein